MKNCIIYLFLFSTFYSCIPLRIAPNIDNYKITKGKRFKRSLPKTSVYIFEDPKEANEFYEYINIKFGLGDLYADTDIPFSVSDETYFFSFYEVEIQDKTLNLAPVVADALLNRADIGPVFSGIHESRKGNFYIAIEAYDDSEKDILLENLPQRDTIISYFSKLKNEYLNTNNYNEVVFKN